jgi:hypothetical protein
LPGGGGHAEVDGGGAAGPAVDLGELVFGAAEADFQAFSFAQPAFAFGFGDAGDQVVADLMSRGIRAGTAGRYMPPRFRRNGSTGSLWA